MLEEGLRSWLQQRLPEKWFAAAPSVEVDGDEVLVVGPLPAAGGEASPRERAQDFREASRQQRIQIAKEVEARFERRVAWGVTVEGETFIFTSLSLPVMTRLRMPERKVLDTLVEAGVARSRSEALAWCVRLVGQHQADWIQELREALVRVGELRRRGPG